MEAAPADGTDTAHPRRGTRLFNAHCAWQWTITRLCTWQTRAGHTGTDTTAHDNARCNPLTTRLGRAGFPACKLMPLWRILHPGS